MNKSEFFSKLAAAFPDELYCNKIEIRFQATSAEHFGDTVKTAVEVTKELGKEWGCEFSVGVEPAFLAITVSCDV